jgi:hypothetical protein
MDARDTNLTAAVTTESAVVAEIEGDRVTVLVGEGAEPWDFPLEWLPERAESGSFLLIAMRDGRPVAVELNYEREAERRRGLERRLARLERVERLTGHSVGGPELPDSCRIS